MRTLFTLFIYPLPAFLILLSSPVMGQEKYNPDSLMKIMPTVHDTQKIRNYHDICRYYVGGDKDKSIEAARSALQIAEKLQEDDWIARCLNVLFAALNIHGERGDLQALAERAVFHAQKSGNKLTLMESYSNLSQYYGVNSIWDKTIEACDKALAIALEIKDTLGIINNYNLIAICHLELNNYVLTEQYHRDAVSLSKKINRPYELGRAYAGLAELYFYQAKWEAAVIHADLGAEAFKQLVYPIGESQALVISASALRQIGNLEASELRCQKVLKLLEEAGNELIRGEIEGILGYIALERKEWDKAEKYFISSEKAASQGKDYKLLKEVYHGLELLNVARNDFQKSKQFRLKYELAADSFLTSKILSNISNYQVKYETAKKEQQLALEKEKRNRLLFISLGVLILMLFAFIYFRNRQKIKEQQTKLEAQMEHAEAERLREIDKIKSTFFANISHEFRTPLSLIVSPLDQMIQGTFKGDKEKYYKIMHRNGKRLLELVNQLLDLSKLESGKLKLEARYGDLSKLIQILVFSYESLSDKKNIQIKLVSESEAMMCYFDRDKVEKILSNLISNAIKFSHDDSSIELNYKFADQQHEIIQIAIRDQGIGIPEDQIPHLFERFAKTTSSEIQPGSGIGLALTKELVELHGGTIQVKNNEGSGTTFIITLQVSKNFFRPDEILAGQQVFESREPATSISPHPASTPSEIKASDGVGKKVLLLVEDNADLRTYIKDQVKDQFAVIEAENGRQGIELAEKNIPDLVITDVMMPEMDGHDFCKHIKSHATTSHIPVIMLTAKADQEDKLAGLKYGADDYLTKPFDARELNLKLANLISRQEKMHQHILSSLTSLTPTQVKADSVDAAFLHQVKEVIEANFDDEYFSVVELSQKIGLSRSQLHRKLTALAGIGPNEIIRNMRLERAMQLLKQKSGNVSEIAYQCGFNSPAYFIKCFRDYFGMTPGEV
jgi:signal transduction histidine kinase/DNA-binding response OmpR family regulator